MRATIALAALLALGPAAGALAEEAPPPFGQDAMVAPEELDGQRGGTETATEISGSIIQSNDTTQTATNNGSVSVTGGAMKVSGQIHRAEVTGNSGITAVMQNTGDLVNMNNATSVNVYLR